MTPLTAAEKIAAISAKFELAETLVSDEVQEVIDTEVKVIVENSKDYHPVDVMSLEAMADDFKFSRELLKNAIYNGKLVLDKATQDLLLSDDDSKASSTMAFAELTTAVLNGIKVHSQLYKDFSTVLLNIKKINTMDNPIHNITNNLNVTDNISTVDLIARLKKTK